MRRVKFVRSSSLVRQFSARGSSVHELVNSEDGASLAAGLVYFKDAHIDFTLWYDEALFCVSREESFSVLVEGEEHFLDPGDMLWLPSGSSLVYRSRGTAAAIWAVTPPDWAKRRPAGV